MRKIPRILVVQRVSLSHSKLKSRSIGARFGPLLNYMQRQARLYWEEILESEIQISDFKRFDVVLLNKHSSARGLEIIHNAKLLGLKTIYDMDDWILDLPSYSVTNLNDDVLANIVNMLREADIVTVSTAVLQKKLQHIRTDAVLLENGFDHEAIPYNPHQSMESTQPRILFSNTDGIKLINYRQSFFNQLITFLNKHPEVEIDFWGDHFPEMHKIPRLNDKGFAENTEYKIQIRDAGYWFALVPLGGKEDLETLLFNSCKSCIKYVDFGSLGIPGIYSNTPVYASVVKHNVSGLVVDNEGCSWLSAIEDMYTSTTIRAKIRHNAYVDSMTRFGLEKSSSIFCATLEKFND